MRSLAGGSNQTTCYVIAYDIPNDKRRMKVHKILQGYSKWTQYSLSECFLTRKQLLLLRSKLTEHLFWLRFRCLPSDWLSRRVLKGGRLSESETQHAKKSEGNKSTMEIDVAPILYVYYKCRRLNGRGSPSGLKPSRNIGHVNVEIG